MLKQVQYLDYDTDRAYSLVKRDAVINLMDIVSMLPVERTTRMPFDDVVRIRFRDGSAMYAIGKPKDFMARPKQGEE